MIQFFRVTPPTVHQMVLSLEKAGLISRKPGVPRSIAVLLERSAFPELSPRDAQPVKTTVTRCSHVRRFKQQAREFLACPSVLQAIQHGRCWAGQESRS